MHKTKIVAGLVFAGITSIAAAGTMSLNEPQAAGLAAVKKILTNACVNTQHGVINWFSRRDNAEFKSVLDSLRAPAGATLGVCVVGKIADRNYRVAGVWVDGESVCALAATYHQQFKPTCLTLKELQR